MCWLNFAFLLETCQFHSISMISLLLGPFFDLFLCMLLNFVFVLGEMGGQGGGSQATVHSSLIVPSLFLQLLFKVHS